MGVGGSQALWGAPAVAPWCPSGSAMLSQPPLPSHRRPRTQSWRQSLDNKLDQSRVTRCAFMTGRGASSARSARETAHFTMEPTSVAGARFVPWRRLPRPLTPARLTAQLRYLSRSAAPLRRTASPHRSAADASEANFFFVWIIKTSFTWNYRRFHLSYESAGRRVHPLVRRTERTFTGGGFGRRRGDDGGGGGGGGANGRTAVWCLVIHCDQFHQFFFSW